MVWVEVIVVNFTTSGVIDVIRMKMVEVVVVMSSSKARYLIIGGIELYFISLNGLI